MSPGSFSASETAAVYRAIYARRDIRNYRPEPVPPDVLQRLLLAAHHAPSVGMMQPWHFVLIEDRALRQRIYLHFRDVNARAAAGYAGERAATYRALKLQGILDAPHNLLVTCDRRARDEPVLGRFTMRHMDEYSTCLAVQNLWLAARAEGVGLGWMSLMEPATIAECLQLPEDVLPVAYLTLGYPVEFPPEPMLQATGWQARAGLSERVFLDFWGNPTHPNPTHPNPTHPNPTHPNPTDPVTDPNPTDPVTDPVTDPIAHPARQSGRQPGPHAGQQAQGSPSAPVETPERTPPAAAQARQAALTKPEGSLGRLEELGLTLCGLQQREHPRCEATALLLFAADHGVSEEGVSAYLRETTARMVYQYAAGGAVVNALCRQHGVELQVVDVGVDHDFAGASGIAHAKVRRGTRNFTREPAMTPSELLQAISAGRAAAARLPRADAVALGEMGIANTTSAAALSALLLGLEPQAVVGRGTGVGDETLDRKRRAVETALSLHRPTNATQALQCVGGYEIAALVGAIEALAERGALVVLDGFITASAALVALARTPAVRSVLVAGHLSAEAGHRKLLAAMELRPLLDLELRLGEGSGAVLALSLVQSAAQLLNEVRTFEEINAERPLDPRGLR